jgi:hypothetical protein
MDLPEYITKDEVKRVCAELGLQDWTALAEPKIPASEAEIIRKEVGGEALQVSLEAFHTGLEVELEHGVVFPDSNVTNNHPLLTGKIVVAHLKEMLDYYERLEVAELEGDLLKAVKAGKIEKAAGYLKRLAAARRALADAEMKNLD